MLRPCIIFQLQFVVVNRVVFEPNDWFVQHVLVTAWARDGQPKHLHCWTLERVLCADVWAFMRASMRIYVRHKKRGFVR